MGYAPGDTFREIFYTQSPTAQSAADADSTPTAIVRRNGADDVTVTATVTHLATGIYEISFAIPAGYAARDNMNVRAQAVVGGKTGNVTVWSGLLGNGILQTGDSYARIGAGGASLNAVPDTGGTTTLLSRLTAARAGYFDNLNVGGPVASHADVVAINLSATKHLLLSTVGQYEPGETYTIEMRTFAAADGSAVNADTTPTLTATGQVSGSLNANLSAATNPATGVYRWTYTPGATPTLEQIRFDGAAVINTGTFTLSCFTQTVDFATAVYSAADQAHLTAIFNKLPAGNLADEALLIAAIGSPQQVGTKYAVTLNSSDVTGNVPAHVLEWNGTAVAGPPPDTIFISSHLAIAATANTITLSAAEPATDNYYRDHLILIVSGTGAGQSAIITGYVGATNVATIDGTWAVTPDATSLYVIMVGAVSVLAASQSFYAPAKAGDQMDLVSAPNANAVTAIQNGLSKPATPQTIDQTTLLPASPVAGSVGEALKKADTNIDATVSSRSTYAGGPVASVTAAVTVGTNNDKSGYGLAADGLDLISVADPGAVANQTTLPKILVALYRRFFKKSTLTASQLKTYADDGTVNSTQAVSDDGTTQTQGTAT